MEIYTIGFTRHTAEEFFGSLRSAGIEVLIDVRLNNSSQLAGFAKRDDLRWFLRELCGADYHHEPLLAPTQELLDRYKKRGATWERYEAEFRALMEDRAVHEHLDAQQFERRVALLCSERSADRCHRRLVVEHLHHHWGGVHPVHL